MGRSKRLRYLQESGLSLVEVLASIVILTLLLTTFLMMFIQSAKVNKASEHVIDATYIAQEEMENIYALSTSATRDAIGAWGLLQQADEGSWNVFEREYNLETLIKVKLLNKKGSMDRVLVEVRGIPDNKLKAQMENVIVWGGN